MMRPLFLVACLGFSLTNSYLAWAAPDFVGAGVRVPELELEDALPIALEEIQRQRLTEKIYHSLCAVCGRERTALGVRAHGTSAGIHVGTIDLGIYG